MDRELVRVCGRSHELGRPYLFGTTKVFLETFGLWSLEDLPRPDLFKQTGHDKTNIANTPCLVGDREVIDSVGVNSDVSKHERDSDVSATTDLETHPLNEDLLILLYPVKRQRRTPTTNGMTTTNGKTMATRTKMKTGTMKNRNTRTTKS